MIECPKLQKRIEALYALAKRGVGGEAVNAEEMLNRMLEKHGYSLADLADDATETVWFNYRTKQEKTILIQLASRTVGKSLGSHWRVHGLSKIGFDLTKAQEVQISYEWPQYRKAFRDEIEVMLSAFIHAQNLYAPSDDEDRGERPKLSPEERARLMRVSDIALKMNTVHVSKAIEAKQK